MFETAAEGMPRNLVQEFDVCATQRILMESCGIRQTPGETAMRDNSCQGAIPASQMAGNVKAKLPVDELNDRLDCTQCSQMFRAVIPKFSVINPKQGRSRVCQSFGG